MAIKAFRFESEENFVEAVWTKERIEEYKKDYELFITALNKNLLAWSAQKKITFCPELYDILISKGKQKKPDYRLLASLLSNPEKKLIIIHDKSLEKIPTPFGKISLNCLNGKAGNNIIQQAMFLAAIYKKPDLSLNFLYEEMRKFYPKISHVKTPLYKAIILQILYSSYRGIKGYIDCAEKFFEGGMLYTYTTISAIAKQDGKEDINSFLDWPGQIYLQVEDFKKLRKEYLQYKGITGYIECAKKFFNGDMRNTHATVSVIAKMDGHEKINNLLSWPGVISTSLEDFNILKDTYMEYKGVEGYMQCATKFFDGNMSTTYTTISSMARIEDKKKINNLLNWPGIIPMFVKDFEILRRTYTQYKNVEGYQRCVKDFFDGNEKFANLVISIIAKLDGIKDVYTFLNWPPRPRGGRRAKNVSKK